MGVRWEIQQKINAIFNKKEDELKKRLRTRFETARIALLRSYGISKEMRQYESTERLIKALVEKNKKLEGQIKDIVNIGDWNWDKQLDDIAWSRLPEMHKLKKLKEEMELGVLLCGSKAFTEYYEKMLTKIEELK